MPKSYPVAFTYNITIGPNDAKRLYFMQVDDFGYIVNQFQDAKERAWSKASDHYSEYGIDDRWEKLNAKSDKVDKQYQGYETYLHKLCTMGLVQFHVRSWGDQEYGFSLTDFGKKFKKELKNLYS